ncbi:MAG: hypothetical protein H6828_06380 [Planctomycetes bacterium]|nr:hypothetical protein [Planctomycetota bacterium]
MRPTLTLATLALLAAPLRAEIWTVSQHYPADFTEVAAAVAAAGEGDTIWVLGGHYGTVEVVGKSVHLAALGDVATWVNGLWIRDLSAAQVVTVSGLDLSRITTSAPLASLSVQTCQGAVRVRDCSIGSEPPPGLPFGGRNLLVEACDDVALTDCTIRPPAYGSASISNLPSAEITGSTVGLYGCYVVGSSGSLDSDGNTALQLTDSTLVVVGSWINGGPGSTVEQWQGIPPSDGGDALVATGACTIFLASSSVWGGVGGECLGGPPLGSCIYPYGDDGADFVLGPQVEVVRSDEPARSWSTTSVAFAPEATRLTLRGQPGDRVFLVRAQPEFAREFDHGGARWIRRPLEAGIYLGELQGTSLEVEVPLNALVPPQEERTFTLQAFVLDATGRSVWLEPRQVSVIDRTRLEGMLSTIYVDDDAPPGGDGRAWSSALSGLDEALAEAATRYLESLRAPVEVWIAGGRYTRVTETVYHYAFQVGFGGSVHGGFAGDETSLDERVLGQHPTVLDGDLLGDDAPGFQNYAENTVRLLQLSPPEDASLLVDGLIVRGARPDQNNVACWVEGDVVLRDCEFRENDTDGSVVFARSLSSASPRFYRCLFAANRSAGSSAGLAAQRGIEVSDCRFLGNESTNWASALSIAPVGLPLARIHGCWFGGNTCTAGNGGTIVVELNSNLNGRVLVTNCSVVDGTGTSGCPAIRIRSQVPGAYAPDRVRLDNSIVWGNASGGLVDEAAQLALVNVPTEVLVVQTSCITGWSGLYGGVGNHGLDPLLSPQGQLGAGSPCIDAGANAVVPPDTLDVDGDGDVGEPWPLDLAGAPRFVDDPAAPDRGLGDAPLIDLGAYERQP